ncbi:sensor histidine kinase [Egbenema bharatensis]|uniref:sensor histidine kinase n=1 Tax=Egbenema bharatensis TaxID=3463334 RepID=UPI003A8A8B6A
MGDLVYKWYLPTISEIMAIAEPEQSRLLKFPAQQQVRAEREWSGAVAALNHLLQWIVGLEQQVDLESSSGSDPASDRTANRDEIVPLQGILLSGPFPVLDQVSLADRISTWMFTVAAPGEILQLLPAANDTDSVYNKIPTLPLLPKDPLAAEQFCLALTTEFSLVMVLGEAPDGTPTFTFSFDPEVARQAWRSLEARVKLATPQMAPAIARLVKQFPPVTPDYHLVTQFSRLMLAHLPQRIELEEKTTLCPDSPVFQQVGTSFQSMPSTNADQGSEPIAPSPRQGRKSSKAKRSAHPTVPSSPMENSAPPAPPPTSDTELLQAIAHEVRTPLTTIRTLTRLLLRRKDLNPDVVKRLEVIDRECTEQIDRFSLIFRAAELETAQTRNLLTSLAPISLEQVLQQNIPRWQQQAHQHNHTLDIILPQKMPSVVTDPAMLDQVLTGLIDRITHSLPPGSHIEVKVSLAGHQLKLQLESHPLVKQKMGSHSMGFASNLKSIGQLLMFQPETGNLSLNLSVTKNLFQALGGKLIVRQRPEEGEVLTIFLPLAGKKE